ncbi:hypothetical protein, partial [Desulfofundulus sp.]|uniref:hypothetical protein n=1 Tax=Desulfofundulus sp. TaxID=2282750 RepID=UPI003C72FBCE
RDAVHHPVPQPDPVEKYNRAKFKQFQGSLSAFNSRLKTSGKLTLAATKSPHFPEWPEKRSTVSA